MDTIATLIWMVMYTAFVVYVASLVQFLSPAVDMLCFPFVIGTSLMGMFWGDVLIGRIFFPGRR